MKNDSAVIKNLLLKRDHPKEHPEIRPLLLTLGGCMRGPYGAGAAVALHALGLSHVFSTVVGLSTGAPVSAYFLAGPEQTAIGASIYYNECASKRFIDLRRLSKIVDIDYLMDVISHGSRALDVPAMKANPTAFYVVATDIRGRLSFLNVKRAQPNPCAAVKASIAIPGIYGRRVKVNGQSYQDGIIHPFPLPEIIARFRPTDILILPNESQSAAMSCRVTLIDHIFGLMARRDLPPHLRQKLVQRKHEFRQGVLSAARIKRPNITILWPPHAGLRELTTDSTKLRQATELSAGTTYKLFTGKNKAFHLAS